MKLLFYKYLVSLCFLLLLPLAVIADKEKAKSEEESAKEKQIINNKIRDNAEQRFAFLELTFKSYSPTQGLSKEDYFSEFPFKNFYYYVEMKKKYIIGGTLLLEGGIFVFPDEHIRWKNVDTAKIRDLKGKVWQAEYLGVGKIHGRAYVKAKDFDKKVDLSRVAHQFKNNQSITYTSIKAGSSGGKRQLSLVENKLKEVLFVGEKESLSKRFHVGWISDFVDDTDLSYRRQNPARAINMIYNDRGEYIGLRPRDYIVQKTKTENNYGDGGFDTLSQVFNLSERKKIHDLIIEKIHNCFYEIKLEFRIDNNDDSFSSRYYGDNDEEDMDPKEFKSYAIAVDNNHLLLPKNLDISRIAKLTKVTYKAANGSWLEAEFQGGFKQFSAFLFRTEKRLQNVPAFSDQNLKLNQMVHCVRVRDRFGKKDIQFKRNRVKSWVKGYKDRKYLSLFNNCSASTFVFDFDGKVRAVLMEEKKYESEADNNQNRYYRQQNQIVPYQFHELFPYLKDPVNSFDSKYKVMTVQEAKKIAWLGVEFQTLSRNLIDELKLKDETRDGRYGLLVNTIYKGSPAEKMGIVVGDILLRVREKSKTEEIELTGQESYGFGGRFFWGGGGYNVTSPDASWFSRQNSLTKILTKLRVGTEVVLYYSHNHKVEEVSYIIEEAPLDYNSAVKYNNEDVGLTVKNITYEVQHRLKLKDNKGVVIYKVEEGSSTAVAGLNPLDFILGISKKGGKVSMNVTDRSVFEKRLEALIQSGESEATLMVRNLTNTRFVNVKLKREEVDPQELAKKLTKFRAE